ncbi:MAG: signal peptidase I [Chloroflexi bacterium]|nr:signal peptidase I [Chloroflexota bacterium]
MGLILFILFVAGLWKSFSKAGQPGWAAIIPILNWYTMLKVAGRPGWWLLLLFVPILNIVIWLMMCLDFAYAFRKSTLYGILIFFFPWLMFLLLGFGDAKYYGPIPV